MMVYLKIHNVCNSGKTDHKLIICKDVPQNPAKQKHQLTINTLHVREYDRITNILLG